MPAQTLENRLAAVENELARLKQMLASASLSKTTVWWETMFGSFAESEGFDEAVKLGREYRQAQHPKGDGKPY